LLEGERLLGERQFARGAGGVGSDTPAEAAEALLIAAGQKPAEVGLVAVSVGPGSYTGLRIGVSFAKTFAWAVGAATVAVPSLVAMAETAVAGGQWLVASEGLIVPTADAFRGQLYAKAFRCEPSGKIVPFTDDLILTADELVKRLAELRSTAYRLFGSGAAKYAKQLEVAAKAANLAMAIGPEPASPSAEAVGRLGLEMFLAGKAVTAHDLVPVYLRKTEAEERAEARERKA
jgi:tRNA threonylcarbamoyladenosine biosynthesis protein TsaB